ncbi:MAG: FAD-binding oxidoreductase [bacterium]
MIIPSRIEGLRGLVTESSLLASPESLLVYRTDASNIPGSPDLVVVPANRDEVVETMRWAHRERVPVVPRGAGTGVTGGAVPIQGGVVIALSRMHRILDIDRANMLAEVEPGVITGDLRDAVDREGLLYPPDPASLKSCTIGGNIAENAGGPKAVKYGVTRDYCLGLEAVLPGGDILTTGARTLKSVVGYDLTRLLVGSEGTLGVITRVFLRLTRKPEAVRAMRLFLPSAQEAVSGVMAILRTGIIPSTLEIMDKSSIQCVCAGLDMDLPSGGNAMLLMEVDGESGEVRRQVERIQALFPGQGLDVARTEEEREELFRFRRSISPAIYRLGARKINEDICVPRDRLAECFLRLDRIASRYGLTMANFGHAGDGNIHVNILVQDEKGEGETLQAAVREIFRMTLELGGSISGEHGIGVTKAPYLAMEINEQGMDVMRRIKALFDPRGILNPGKIFGM